MKPSLTVVIVARNEVLKLEKCLQSADLLSAPIVVIDLESTDQTVAVAKKHGAKVIAHKYVTTVEQIRDWSLTEIRSEYVLFLDPDETVTRELSAAMIEIISSAEIDYFLVPRKNIIFGKWLKHSRWWPDYQVRLFRKGAVKWPKELHLKPVYKGVSYQFEPTEKMAIQHDNYTNLDEWFEKNRRYAKQDAKDRFDQNNPLTLADAMRLSVSELVSRFFADKGYQDGMRGLILSILQSFYYFLVYAYYWELAGYRELEQQESIRNLPQNWFRHGLREILYWDKSGGNPVKQIKTKLVRKFLA